MSRGSVDGRDSVKDRELEGIVVEWLKNLGISKTVLASTRGAPHRTPELTKQRQPEFLKWE